MGFKSGDLDGQDIDVLIGEVVTIGDVVVGVVVAEPVQTSGDMREFRLLSDGFWRFGPKLF